MTGNPGKPASNDSSFGESLFGLDNRIPQRTSGLGSVSEREAWSPLQREAYVLAGIGDGVGQSLSDAFGKDLPSTGLKVGGAAILGGGLAYLREASTMGEIGAIVIGAGLTYALLKDVVRQAVPTYHALKEAAGSGKNLDQNRAVVAATAGPFCVDFALSSAGGLLGAGTVRAFQSMPEVVPSRRVVAASAAEPASPTLSITGTKMMDATTVAEAPAAHDVYFKTLPSLLKIESARPNGVHTGTALVIGEDGRALTNFHVVAHSENIFAVTPEGARFQAVVEKVDPGTDLALLRLGRHRILANGHFGADLESFTPAEIADSNPLPQQRVFGIGYGNHAAAENPKLSQGTVTAIETPPAVEELPSTLRPAEQVVRSQVELEPGFSGGPLLAESGDVVAVNFAKTKDSPQSFSVPAETIHRFLESKPTVDYSRFVPMLETAQRSPASAAWKGKESELGALYDTARKGVVQIMSNDTAHGDTPVYATAFAVDPFYLVTDAKAVGAVGSPVKATYNGTLHDLLTVDKKYHDLGVAILRSDRRWPLELEPLKLAPNSTLVRGGQRTVTFGFKADQAEMTASAGQFGAYVPGPGDAMFAKTLGSVDNGYGGAPVFNHEGRIVAMTPFVTESASDSTNINLRNIRQAMRLAGLL